MQEVTDSSVPQMAPGCYASPSVFASDSDICRGCPTFDACGAACVETLHAIRDRINVDALLARHRDARQATIEAAPREEPKAPETLKFLPSVKPSTEKAQPKLVKTHKPRASAAITPAHQAIIDGISQSHAKGLAIKMARDGMLDTIRTELAAGRNPFRDDEASKYYGVACEELLKGPLTRQTLKQVFQKRMGKHKPWDEKSAASHAGTVFAMLGAIGAVIESPAGYVVNPGIGRDNV